MIKKVFFAEPLLSFCHKLRLERFLCMPQKKALGLTDPRAKLEVLNIAA
jgi:hypothetical protein